MPRKSFSIRRRILLAALGVLLVLSLGIYAFLQDYAQRSADQAFDRVLAASALSIAGAISLEDNHLTVELPYAAMAMLSSQQRVFYSIRDPQGTLVTGYDDLDQTMPLAQSATPEFTNLQYRGDLLRVATLGRLISFNRQIHWITIRVAESREARDALAAEILQRGALPLPIIAIAALVLLWIGISRAFQPLRGLERELRQRLPEDLAPLRSPAPREVTRLVDAVNDFMRRLQTILDMLHNLLADTAHQVRTPLASLRAQAEVALEESDPQKLKERLQRILRNANSASLLINQVLMDATITHRLGAREQGTVSLEEVLNEVRQRIGTQDIPRLKIALAPALQDAVLLGDRIALREMLLNLIDNALRHAPDSELALELRAPGSGQLLIEVADRGPGIPESEQAEVLKRFVRGAAARSTPGSGLGLAIVQSVVQSHRGTLTLRNRPGGGLIVRVSLPLDTQSPQPNRKNHLASLALFFCCAIFLAGGRPSTASAQTSYYPAPSPAGVENSLAIAGPTDTPVFAVLAKAFQREHPGIGIVYHERSSRELYEQTRAGTLPASDVLISSAADLQLRLANDGYAQAHRSAWTERLPEWANWRSEVFGFTSEPVVMVYNTDHYSAASAPRSRAELLRTLEQKKPYARIGTYDIAASSVGHLLATQDEMISSNFWGMANALGRAGVYLAPDTREILDLIQADKLDLGYNMLGSYVKAYGARYTKLGVIVPEDYQLILTRCALILKDAAQPQNARIFIDWLLSPGGQLAIETEAALGALPELLTNEDTEPEIQANALLRPIALNPSLLVGLDQQRQAKFLQNWARLVTDTPEKTQENPDRARQDADS